MTVVKMSADHAKKEKIFKTRDWIQQIVVNINLRKLSIRK